jgi:hypothetical protein
MTSTHFDHVYLFHGKGGRPTGSVLQLEDLLRSQFETASFTRPRLLHGDPEVTAEESLEDLRHLGIPQGSAIIGISLGGLLAAKLQETSREDLHVVCISSPTWADDVALSRRMSNRLALYSSRDDVIQGRTGNWPQLAQACDLPWLTHDTDAHKKPLSQILQAFLLGKDVFAAIGSTEDQLRLKGEID